MHLGTPEILMICIYCGVPVVIIAAIVSFLNSQSAKKKEKAQDQETE